MEIQPNNPHTPVAGQAGLQNDGAQSIEQGNTLESQESTQQDVSLHGPDDGAAVYGISAVPNDRVVLSRRHQDRMAMQLSMLPSLPVGKDEATGTEFKRIVQNLHELQRKGDGRFRFHLIQEVVGPAAARTCHQSSSAPHKTKLRVRILFSPTIFINAEAGENAEMLFDSLAGYFKMDYNGDCVPPREECPSGLRNQASEPERTDPRPSSPEPGTGGRPEQSVGQIDAESLRCSRAPFNIPIDAVKIPSWFPGKEGISREHYSGTTMVDDKTYQMFASRTPSSLMWIYKTVFHLLYKVIQRTKHPAAKRNIVYSQFTPPWLRRTIRVENQTKSVVLAQVLLSDLKKFRYGTGHFRVALLLSSLYLYEPHFVKPAISFVFINEASLLEYESSRPDKRTKKRTRASGDGHAAQPPSDPAVQLPPVRTLGILQDNGVPVPDASLSNQPDPPNPLSLHETASLPHETPANAPPTMWSEDSNYIVCAAQKDCKLSAFKEAQNPLTITGKCRVCNLPLHDICGDHENGVMLCGPGNKFCRNTSCPPDAPTS